MTSPSDYLYQKTCRECGHTFYASRRDKLYCSSKCRKRFSRRRERIQFTLRDLFAQITAVQTRLPEGDQTVRLWLQNVTPASVTLLNSQNVTPASVTLLSGGV